MAPRLGTDLLYTGLELSAIYLERFRRAEIDAGHRQGLSSPNMQQPATAMGEAVEELFMIQITARQ